MNGARGYLELAVPVAANTWTLAVPFDCGRNSLVLGDFSGLGCSWSLNPAPVAGEGIPWSVPGTPNSWDFESHAPSNAVYVYAQTAGTVTVVVG